MGPRRLARTLGALRQPIGLTAPLGDLGEALPGAVCGLARLLLQLAEGLVNLGRVLQP